MSYYYDYYLGIKDKDGKIKPLGPYDNKGKLHSIFCKSRSFASRLYENFYPIRDEQITEELRLEFKCKNWKGEEVVDVKYLPLKELPGGNFIKKGFYLIEDIRLYEENNEVVGDLDIFYDWIPEKTYYRMLQNQKIRQISPIHEKVFGDDEEEYSEHRDLSEYCFYCYPDYDCEAYEAHMIRVAVNMYDNWYTDLPDGEEIVILETEG